MAKIKRYFDSPSTEQKGLKNKIKKQKRSNKKFTTTQNKTKHKVKPQKSVQNVNKINTQSFNDVRIPKEVLFKHSRGEGLTKKGIRTGIHKRKQIAKERNVKFATEQAARVENLLPEEGGFLEAEPGETTTQFTQGEILKSVDIAAATKQFELKLTDFGPYRARYTRNGRHLALGGKLGHVAAFDWITKKLHFEINVMETVHDICWLHIETMLAVAQKNWVYMYDNQGIELHCLKTMNKVSRMEFLPYHFLLATASEDGYLSWLDVSIGKMVVQYNTKLGRLSMLAQNPYNAVLCVGGSKGVVSMWAPNTHQPLAKILCHNSAMTALHVDPRGRYMATAGGDRLLKVWDVRMLHGPLQIYRLKSQATNLSFSQKDMLAVSMGNIVEIYRDCCMTTANRAYVRHRLNNTINNFEFCPYEDVLGVGSTWGFTSLLVPGAGEPNFDAYEANPYQQKSQRREAEVKALLEKIPADLITLDPTKISDVDVPTLQDKVEAKKKLLFVKPPKIKYEPRHKAKGKGGSVKIARNKKIVQEQTKKEFVQKMKNVKNTTNKLNKKKSSSKVVNVLDRFLPKKK